VRKSTTPFNFDAEKLQTVFWQCARKKVEMFGSSLFTAVEAGHVHAHGTVPRRRWKMHNGPN